MATDRDAKLKSLRAELSSLDGAVIAYSGGVDSTLLLAVAADVLPGRVIAVVASSQTYPSEELSHAVETAAGLGVQVEVIETDELSDPKFVANTADRCYWCKRELFSRLTVIAEQRGGAAVLDGSNVDDLDDERPGMRAAKEAGVRSPLIDAGLTKAEIRALSRKLGLATADKPSMACLASRFPYGCELAPEILEQVGRAEAALREMGFAQVRVRYHGPAARIEVDPGQLDRALARRDEISKSVKQVGFVYVSLDLDGYRTGSANEVARGVIDL